MEERDMLPIAVGTTILNAMTHNDIPECAKDEMTLCREARERGRAHGTWAVLVPGVLLRALRRRQQESALRAAILRLEETSPHLLRDIGIARGLGLDDDTPEGAEADARIARPVAPAPVRRPPVRVPRYPAPVLPQNGAFA
jgi:uncharacterized protein YjiS (DUF1127 family)